MNLTYLKKNQNLKTFEKKNLERVKKELQDSRNTFQKTCKYQKKLINQKIWKKNYV